MASKRDKRNETKVKKDLAHALIKGKRATNNEEWKKAHAERIPEMKEANNGSNK